MGVSLEEENELKTQVYNAAREGKVATLKDIRHKRKIAHEELLGLVNSRTNGATPLIMACRHGHANVAEFLIEKCSADVELPGSVTFDGETIDGAPPLWCAAAAGHLDIVRYLIRFGAKVNNTTYTNSTPLRAACFDGHFEIVHYLVEHNADIEIANRHGHTCLMISCYKGHYKIVKYLIDKGADANRKSGKGNTALHDCAESGSLDIMKLLLEHKARMAVDSYGMTPLLASAVTGHTKIVEFLTSQPECDRLQKISALRLLGATYVDKKRDMLGALKFWKLAMAERYKEAKYVVKKPSTQELVSAYDNVVEVQTMKELEDLIADPDKMRMQALLVREKILGPAHPDTSYYIRYRGAVYADMGNFDRCITLWMYALDMQQQILEAVSPMTQSSFLSFAELFSFMMTETRSKKPYPVDIRDMIIVYEKAVQELERGYEHMQRVSPTERDTSHFNRLLVILMHLTSLLCQVQSRATEEEQYQFKKLVYLMVRMNVRGSRGQTPLHLACSKDTTTVGRYPVCAFPSLDVAQVLLEVGAKANALDEDRNSPLHVVAKDGPSQPSILQLLLENGAHIDACNNDGEIPLELLSGCPSKDFIAALNYTTLQCLAAKSLVKHRIAYKGKIPHKLELFVGMHDPGMQRGCHMVAQPTR